MSQLQREKRDLAVAKLEKRYEPKLARIQERIRKVEARVEREKEQYGQRRMETAVSIGSTVLGAILGRRGKATTVGRAATSARTMGRAAREKGDIKRAKEDLAAQHERLQDLDAEFREALAEVQTLADPSTLEVKEVPVRPRKTDISVDQLMLVWTPWKLTRDGIAEPVYDLEI